MVSVFYEELSESESIEGEHTASSRGRSEAWRRGAVRTIPELVRVWQVLLDVFV